MAPLNTIQPTQPTIDNKWESRQKGRVDETGEVFGQDGKTREMARQNGNEDFFLLWKSHALRDCCDSPMLLDIGECKTEVAKTNC